MKPWWSRDYTPFGWGVVFDPVTASVLVGAAALVKGVGAIKAGNDEKTADDYNAEVEQQRATEATDQANAQAQLDAQSTARKLGSAAAAYGASGVETGQGSPLSVMADQATQGELTRQFDLYRGRITALADTQQASIDRKAGQVAQTAGEIGAVGSLLDAGGRIAAANASPSLAPTSTTGGSAGATAVRPPNF